MSVRVMVLWCAWLLVWARIQLFVVFGSSGRLLIRGGAFWAVMGRLQLEGNSEHVICINFEIVY